MSGDVLLKTDRLTRAFGSLLAVDRVDVEVREGEHEAAIQPRFLGV